MIQKEDGKGDIKKSKADNTCFQAKGKQIDDFFCKKYIKVEHSREAVLKGIVELIAVNGRPIKVVDDIGFKTLMSPVLSALNMSLNRENVKSLLIEKADDFRKQITSKLAEHPLISLKVDCATNSEKSFIGINSQFIENGNVVIYTLACVEVCVSHTGIELKNIILREIRNYGLELQNIYTVTTDNGANVIKAVQLMKESENEIDEELDISDISILGVEVDDMIESVIEELSFDGSNVQSKFLTNIHHFRSLNPN